LFTRHFLDERLIAESFRTLIEAAQQARGAEPREGGFAGAADAPQFLSAVEALYRSMDDSLRFKPDGEPGPVAESRSAPAVDRQADFRGVVCPLNFVKTKMALASMARGNVLSVLLDEAGARNVPGSVAQEGHEMLGVEREHDHWRVLIRKA
jgi:sulfite reductase (ferredoxin)